MRTRIISIASVTAVAALLAACGTVDPYGPNNYPSAPISQTTYPSTYPATYPVATSNFVEYGRISNIELVQAANPGAPSGNTTAGTLIGGAVGALLGNQVGHGDGRAAATVLGAVGGAVVGNQIAKNRDGSNSASGAVYRISVQSDNGQWRSYDVPATGDLRVGDRVRIENNVLYRS